MEAEIKPFIGKVVKNGNSYHISIPSYIRKYMNIEQGDLLDIEKLKLIKDKELKENAMSQFLTGKLFESNNKPLSI